VIRLRPVLFSQAHPFERLISLSERAYFTSSKGTYVGIVPLC
jgi:hypothetical protein